MLRRFFAASFALFALFGSSSFAHADNRTAGAVSVGAALSTEDVGAGGIVDLWAPFGAFRVGGAIGMMAISSDDGARSRVFAPVLASAAYVLEANAFRLDLRVRVGGWAGATDFGLQGGAMLGGGLWLGYAFAPHVAILFGSDMYWQSNTSDGLVFAPGLSFSWRPMDES